METFFWIAIFAALLLVEGFTMGLTTIWFAGGALVAFVLSFFHVPLPIQIIVFIVVSILLLCLTRPLAMKYLNNKKGKTNYDGIIGKVAKVIEKVDNYNATGAVTFNGQEWSARSEGDADVFEPGTLVKVVNIAGVKVVVTKYVED